MSAVRSSQMLAAGTGTRVLLAPAVMALLLNHADTAAAIVFAIAAATDWFDGRLARRWGVTTPLGAFLDTTADKLLVATALIALVSIRRASPWIALIIVGREFAILGLRVAVVAGGQQFEASIVGKWKATVQFVALTLAMLRPSAVIASVYLDQWAMLVAAIITAWSGLDYIVRFSATLRSGRA